MTFLFWHALELDSVVSEKTLFGVLFLPNPYCNLFFNTMTMMTPRLPVGMPSFAWPLHCGIILAASAALLSVCVIRVRKVGQRQATGESVSSRKRRSRTKASQDLAGEMDLAVEPRRILGPPVLWKEWKSPLLGRRRFIGVTTIASISLIVLLITYFLCGIEGALHDKDVQEIYAVVFLCLGILSTVVLASTCITSEKESRSWPLLLATTLDDRDILLGKFVGAVRRCSPPWLLLLGHTFVFALVGVLHPAALLQICILIIWVVMFLAGSGLYFSSCYKRTTTAVTMNFALAAAIWCILPFIMGIIGSINHDLRPSISVFLDTNPFVHAVVVFAANVDGSDKYHWVTSDSSGSIDGVRSTAWMLACMAGYVSVGLMFAWRAKCRFRRNIF